MKVYEMIRMLCWCALVPLYPKETIRCAACHALRRLFLVWLRCAARRKRLGVLLKSLSLGIRYALKLVYRTVRSG